MIDLRPGLAFLIVGVLSLEASGYDLQVTCKSNGQLQDWAIENATSDLDRIKAVDIAELCQDADFCMGQFRAIGKLTRQIVEINKQINEMKQLQNRAKKRNRNAILELQDRVDDCLNNQSPLLNAAFAGDKIAIIYPHKGMNANQSAMYDKGKVEWIVENALRQGVDPFAALSIKLLEDAEDLATSAKPPNQAVEEADMESEEDYNSFYSDEYGRIPVDSIGAYDVNKCLNPKGTFNYVSKRAHAAPYAQLTSRLETAREALIDAERSNDVVNYQIAESELEYLNSELDTLKDELPTEAFQKSLEAQSFREQIMTIDAYLKEMQNRPDVANYLSSLETVRIYEDNIETLKKSILGVRISPRPPRRPSPGTSLAPTPLPLSEEARQFEARALEMVEAELECTQNRLCYTSIRTPDRRVVYELDTNATQTHTICDTESLTIDRAHAPQFSVIESGETATGCCVDVKSNGDREDLEHRIGEVKGLMGLKYFKDRVQIRARDGSISHALQAFNGYGVFGSSEEMDNNCLEGINMNAQPVYGARAADLMINGLMNNPAIREIVKRKQNSVGRAPTSMFCLQSGSGVHKIDGLKFLNEQKNYLNKPECSRYFRNRWLESSGG